MIAIMLILWLVITVIKACVMSGHKQQGPDM